MSEADLIQRARAGDTDAWEALTRLHQGPVYRYAYLLNGDPDEAQDVAQEAFIRAFYGLKRFHDGRPLRPWLLRITARLGYNRQRSARRFMQALERWIREPSQQPEAGSAGEEADELRSAVSRLRRPFQEVLYLRYFLELSEAEAAAALGVPPGTVKSRQHRALQELRELITVEYPELMESAIG